MRDTGKYGFALPPDQIEPSAKETFAAVESMAEDMIVHYQLNDTIPATGAPAPPVDEAVVPDTAAASQSF